MTIRKVIELFFHPFGETDKDFGFYATEIAVKTEESPIQRLIVTFSLNGDERIDWGSVRALSELYVGRKHNSFEVHRALTQFFDDRKTTVKEYMKKINTLEGL